MSQEVRLVCPYCGNDDPDNLSTRPKPSAWAFVLGALLFNFPVIFRRKNVYCFNCHQNFPLPVGYIQKEQQ